MGKTVDIVGAGLAGSECALQLANRGIHVTLYEMRPKKTTPVHHSDLCAELVCSNSLKSTKAQSAAGMLKFELEKFGSELLKIAYTNSVPAGGALAVDRDAFAQEVTTLIEKNPYINLQRTYVEQIPTGADAVVLASGPLTDGSLAQEISAITGTKSLSFYDAAAPIVMADSLDFTKLFSQSRYEAEGEGDYVNAAMNKEEYEAFITELCRAQRVIHKEFETTDLFQACQPIEEIARKGIDAPRFGAMKPVGLVDPKTGKRPWAALQLRKEDGHGASYNLVGFQTNLTFSEQQRIFRMIPGLEQAEFARYGVMHRNTFIDAPHVLNAKLQMKEGVKHPVYIAGQLGGTEGYCEAIMSGFWVALNIVSSFDGKELPSLPQESAFGALLAYATNPETKNYQPMHVNFGIMPPLKTHIRNKKDRYGAYAARGHQAIDAYLASSTIKDGSV